MQTEINVLNIIKRIEQIKNKLAEKINNLPQNSKIKILNDNCFIVNTKDLSSDLVLSPVYYNFKRQYEFISEKISNANIENVPKILKEMIKPKKICNHILYQYDKQRLHPEAIKYLKEII